MQSSLLFLSLIAGALAAPTLRSEPIPRQAGVPKVDPGALRSLPGPGRLAWADIDFDGLDDLLALSGGKGGRAVLLRNRGDGGFDDVTEDYGLGLIGSLARASWQDVDLDGGPDLLAVGAEGELHLFLLRGRELEEVTETSGLRSGFPVQEERWLDYDRDGWVDLLVVGATGPRLFHNLGGAVFAPEDLPVGGPPALESSPAARLSSGFVGGPVQGEVPPSTLEPGGVQGAPDASDAKLGLGGAREPLSSKAATEVVPRAGERSPFTAEIPIRCAPTVKDVATGSCLTASSIPALGALYPISQDWYVDPVSGHVGLGTTTPGRPLELLDGRAILRMRTETSSKGSTVELMNSTPSPTYLGTINFLTPNSPTSPGLIGYLANPDAMIFRVAGSERVRVAADGKVGIGTSNPLSLLSVNDGSIQGTAARIQSLSGSNGADTMIVYQNGTGHALNASTNQGAYAIKASGQGGIHAIGGTAGYGIRAENPNGIAAGFFEGNLQVGEWDNPFGQGNQLVARADIGLDPLGAAYLSMKGGGNYETVHLDAQDADGSAKLILRGFALADSIVLDANDGSGKGRIITDVLDIRGGADLVEGFDTGDTLCEPGTVVVIDSENPGRLTAAGEPYDVKVAGVVSGAGGVEPGISLGQDGVLSGATKVALTGRVWVRATTESGPIRAGDRLTTSSTPGRAMRVADASRADGAVLGKAMSVLDEGEGLVLVLVNLQ